MKKNTIYTMICTTIMLSGNCLGAEEQPKEPKTPLSKFKQQAVTGTSTTPVSKINKEISEIPKTPDVSEVKQQYMATGDYTPIGATYYAKKDVALKSGENAMRRAELEKKAREISFDRQIETMQQQEEEKLKLALEERRAELEAAERKNQEIDGKMEEARLREEQKEKLLELLKEQLGSMNLEAEKAKTELEKTKLELEKAGAVESELKVKVEEANTAVASEKKKKALIVEDAEAQIENRDKKIKEMQKQIDQTAGELYATKLEREKLKLEKETILKVQAVKIGSGNIQGLPTVPKTLGAVSTPQLQKNIPVDSKLVKAESSERWSPMVGQFSSKIKL